MFVPIIFGVLFIAIIVGYFLYKKNKEGKE